jgi:hypothetical protein
VKEITQKSRRRGEEGHKKKTNKEEEKVGTNKTPSRSLAD